ncbi:MAG: fimbrillin family protein [Bacteroidetes bacterium]|nr:fimbrillin family protein [Bacteroidota bacterium]
MKKTLLIASIVAMTSFSSCSKDEIVSVNQDSNKMEFNAYAGSATKAIVTVKENFQSFNLYGFQTTEEFSGNAPLTDAYINNELFTKENSSSPWEHEKEFFWSVEPNDRMQFFGVSEPITLVTTGNYPSFGYAIDVDLTKQEDFMVSVLLNQTKPANDAKVSLDFDHVLSQINFSLKGESTGFNYAVTKIELLDVNSQGIYTFNNDESLGAWSEQKEVLSYGFDLSNVVVDGTNVTEINDKIMMLLPQTLPADAKIKVTYSVKQEGRDSKIFDGSKEISLASREWENNTRTRYTLTLPTGAKEMTFDTNIGNWEYDTDEDLSIFEINKKETIIFQGTKEILTTNLTPADGSVIYTWSSSDEAVALVNETGEVTAVAGGVAVISVDALDAFKKVFAKATCKVTVNGDIPFEDPKFKSAILNKYPSVDVDKNGEISLSEALAVTELELEEDFSSIKGVAYFKNLTLLNFGGSSVTEFDVSENLALQTLKFYDTSVENFDVTKNTELTYLDCGETPIKTIDVSKNLKLKELSCGQMAELTALDVTNNVALTTLYCSDSEGITSIDVSKNTLLTYLQLQFMGLTSLNVEANTLLTELNCEENKIASLDVTANTLLTKLSCSSNKIISLNVTANTLLTDLSCSHNSILALDVTDNVALANLDFSNCSLLTAVTGLNNKSDLKNIYLTGNVLLKNIDCSQCPLLSLVKCSNSSVLESVKLGGCTELTHLYLNDCNLTGELDIYYNEKINYFNCLNNPLLKSLLVCYNLKDGVPAKWEYDRENVTISTIE